MAALVAQPQTNLRADYNPLLTQSCEQQTNVMNHRVLKHYFPNLNEVIKTAPYTVVYTFSPHTETWEKSGCEGSMFLCRLNDSSCAIMVLNKKSMDNFRVELHSEDDVEITNEYIITQSVAHDGSPEISGIWFYDAGGQTSREEMGAAIMEELAHTAHQGETVFPTETEFAELHQQQGYDMQPAQYPEMHQQQGYGMHTAQYPDAQQGYGMHTAQYPDVHQQQGYGVAQQPVLGAQTARPGQPIDLLKLFAQPQIQQETHVATAPPQTNGMSGQQMDLLKLFGRQ